MNEDKNVCGFAKTMTVLEGKWTIILLYYLFQGKNRFGQLQKAMPGISPKTLSLRLKELENEIIITKKIFAEVPLHVEYSLTPRGQLLFKIIHAMDEWGSENPNNRIDPKVKHFK